MIDLTVGDALFVTFCNLLKLLEGPPSAPGLAGFWLSVSAGFHFGSFGFRLDFLIPVGFLASAGFWLGF